MKRVLYALAFLAYFGLPHAAHAQTAFQTCAFSDPTHCYGIGPGSSGQAYMSNGPSAYPSFSSSLPGVTSIGGVTIPATASEFVTAPTTITSGLCLVSTTTAGLGTFTTCPGGGGGTPGGTNFELQYNNSGTFGGIALGTLGYPLISDGGAGAPAFGQLDLTLGVTGILPVANGGTGTATPGLIAGTNVTITGAWPNQTINSTSTASTAFSALTSSTNTTAAMVVGSGASLGFTGTGVLNANQLNGAAVPTSAQLLASNASNQLTAASIAATTQVIYNQAGTLTGNSNFTWNQSSNVLNLGASTTPGTLSIGSLDSMTVNGSPIPIPGFALNSNIQGVIENHSYVNGTAAGAARIYLARSEGTISAPTIVANGDSLGTIYGIGYGGVTGNYLTGGFMRFSVDGTPSSTAMPTDWTLALAPAGSTTAATVIKAYQDAGVTIGAPTGGDKGAGTLNATGLYVNGVAALYSGGPLGTPSSGVGTNITGVNAASVGGFTLPCTVPTLVSGDYLTNNGTTCSWAAVAGSGTINAAAQYAVPYYSAAGSATTLSGLVSPTSGAGYYTLRFDPTSATAVAPTTDQVGASIVSISGATSTYTVPYSIVNGMIVHDKAGSAAVTVTLPTPTTLNNTHFATNYCNDSANTDTITPTTWTIALNNAAAGASISIATGVCISIVVDPFNATQWDAFSYGATSGSGTVTTTGTPASGYLTAFSGSTSITGTANATLSAGALTLGASGTAGSIQLGNATSGTVTLQPVTGALGTVTASLPANTGTIAETNFAQSFSNTQTFTGQFKETLTPPTGSTAAVLLSGSPYTAGTATTNFPLLYLNAGATGPTDFSTAGTFFGVNAASGFTGNFLDFHVNGGASVAKLDYAGNLTVASCTGCGAAGTAFSGITTGTNTTATMTVGSGASMTTTGTGTIAATSVTGLSVASGKTLTASNSLTLAGTDSTTMTFPSTSATITQTIASGTATLGTAAIASGACATVVTVAATGVATTDVIHVGFNGDPTAVTGYGVSATGAVLTIYPYPTAGNINIKVCNSTSASITPGALTLNWRVTR